MEPLPGGLTSGNSTEVHLPQVTGEMLDALDFGL